MRRTQPLLSLLILTEDSASDGPATIAALVKKMLALLVRGVQTQLVDFEPQNEQAAQATRGNLWKSTNPRDRPKLVDLRRSIATKLLEGGADLPGFVLFHFDGDRPWSDHETSENVASFGRFVDRHVRPNVAEILRKVERPQELEQRLMRLRPLVPFYSIEAWLYQNTTEALRICAAGCGSHLEQIRSWEADPGRLDEVIRPKSREFSCLGSTNNRSLAAHAFPADRALRADKSFAAAIWSLLESEELMAALLRTTASPL